MLRFILIILLAALTSFTPSSEKKEIQDVKRSYNYFIEFDLVTQKKGDWRESYNEFTFKEESIIHYSTTFNTTVYRILGSPRRATNLKGFKYTDYEVVYKNKKYQILFWDNVNRGVWLWQQSNYNNVAIEFNNPR